MEMEMEMEGEEPLLRRAQEIRDRNMKDIKEKDMRDIRIRTLGGQERPVIKDQGR